MADDWLSPIIDQMVTILQANLSTEIDDLDTSLEDIPNQFMHKAAMQYNLQYPSIEIFPSGQSGIDPNYTNGTIDFDWRIVTIINLTAKDEEAGELDMRKYMTAVIKTLEKGTGSNDMTIDGKARFAGPIGVDFVSGGDPGNIVFSIIIIWQIVLSQDSLA